MSPALELVRLPPTFRPWFSSARVPVPEWARLLKLPVPASRLWLTPFNITVPPSALNVPPVIDQLPETLKCPDVLGAVSVPVDKVTSVVVTVPVAPVKVPPLTTNPPFKDCVFEEAR